MLEFKGFHPKDVKNEVALKLTDSGVHYQNLANGALQYIPYREIAGFSSWRPGYGSLHIYSTNPNLMIHLNFAQEVADHALDQIQAHLQEKV